MYQGFLNMQDQRVQIHINRSKVVMKISFSSSFLCLRANPQFLWTVHFGSTHYTNHRIECHRSYLSCSILIVNCPCSVTGTKCKPNIICHSSLKRNRPYRFKVLQLLALTKWFFHPIFNHSWQNLIIGISRYRIYKEWMN